MANNNNNHNNKQRIAALEQAIAKARYERDMLQFLLDTQQFYSYVRDTDLRFIFSNKAHRQLLGVSSVEEVTGKKDSDFFEAEAATNFELDDRRVVEQGEFIVNRVEKATTNDGMVYWHLTNKQPIRDEHGTIIGLVGTTRDVTEEKRQEAIIKAQQNILREVGTPIIPVAEGIVILPLIGDIDSQRAVDIMRATLVGITQHNATTIIIDITGVPIVDTGVADYFNHTIQAVKLKGAKVILTGISEDVAEAIVDLGIDWSHIDTLPDLQTGLQHALSAHKIFSG